jgi:hypothetical protein
VNIIGWLAFNIVFYLPFCGVWVIVSVGLFIAFLQWIILEKYIRMDAMWIWSSFVPYAAFHFLFYYLRYFMDINPTLFYLSLIAIFGVLGFLQWRVLDFYVSRASLWLVNTPIIGFIATLMSLLANQLLIDPHKDTNGFFWFVFGCIYGVFTGITLVLLETIPGKKQEVQP